MAEDAIISPLPPSGSPRVGGGAGAVPKRSASILKRRLLAPGEVTVEDGGEMIIFIRKPLPSGARRVSRTANGMPPWLNTNHANHSPTLGDERFREDFRLKKKEAIALLQDLPRLQVEKDYQSAVLQLLEARRRSIVFVQWLALARDQRERLAAGERLALSKSASKRYEPTHLPRLKPRVSNLSSALLPATPGISRTSSSVLARSSSREVSGEMMSSPPRDPIPHAPATPKIILLHHHRIQRTNQRGSRERRRRRRREALPHDDGNGDGRYGTETRLHYGHL